jgi:hypothetical protein
LPLFIGDKTEGPVSEDIASNRKQCSVNVYSLFYELISLRYIGALRVLVHYSRCTLASSWKPVLSNLWGAFCGLSHLEFIKNVPLYEQGKGQEATQTAFCSKPSTQKSRIISCLLTKEIFEVCRFPSL